MTFLDKIEEIQNKPEDYRKRLFVVVMVVSIAVVFSLWIVSFRFSLGEKKIVAESDVGEVEKNLVEKGASPFEMLKNSFENGIDKLSSVWSDSRENLKEVKESVEILSEKLEDVGEPEFGAEKLLEQQNQLEQFSSTTIQIGDLELIEIINEEATTTDINTSSSKDLED